MKVAVAGKGGCGKTTVAGTLARVFAAKNYDVLAIDDDDDPDLAVSLGGPHDAAIPSLPDDLVDRRDEIQDETSYYLTSSPDTIFEEYSVAGPDGVSFLQSCEVTIGDGGSFFTGHTAVSLALSDYDDDPGEAVVLDMAPHVDYLGVANDVDVLLLVGEPVSSSLETVRKMYVVARGVGIPEIRIVANGVRDEHDRTVFENYCSDRSLEVDAVIPHDDALQAAERERTAPVDYDDGSPAVRAIADLADDLVATHGRRPVRQDPTD